MRSSIGQGLFGAIIQLQPLPWDDSFFDIFVYLLVGHGIALRGLHLHFQFFSKSFFFFLLISSEKPHNIYEIFDLTAGVYFHFL